MKSKGWESRALQSDLCQSSRRLQMQSPWAPEFTELCHFVHLEVQRRLKEAEMEKEEIPCP